MANKFTILASAARTASTTVISVTEEGTKGVHLNLNITATSTSPTLDVKLQRLDWLSGNWIDLPGGNFAQQSTITSVDLIVYPGIAETANVSVSDVTTEEIRTVATLGGTSTPSVTYSVSGRWLK